MPDWGTLLGSMATDLLAGSGPAIGVALAVFAALAGFGITLKFLRKGGAK